MKHIGKGKALSILLAAALLLALCACGKMAAPMDNRYDGKASDTAYEMAQDAPQEPASPPSPGYSGYAGGQIDLYANLPENVKMIFTANLEMETTEYDLALQQIAQTVTEMEGYFQERNLRNYGTYRSASFTVRVPAEQFQNFCTRMGEVCKVTRFGDSSENVGEQYYDTEARLATQRTKLERLQELLSKAEEMEDIITLESAISDTEYVIEQLTGTLRHYDSLVGYSTVYLELSEVYKLSPGEEPAIGFGARLMQSLRTGTVNFIDGAEKLLLVIAEGWVGWLIFLIVVIVVILLIRRSARRRRARREVRYASAAPAAPAAPVAPIQEPVAPAAPAEEKKD
ncbi:MAG: DUF4349 domain-containing protein [Clostridia bacterium]|nr:DUF4349 domain-containing protein [Clostridia bacterium]